MMLKVLGAVGIAAAVLAMGAQANTSVEPTVIAALGDSITAAWGSSGSPGDNTAASWATGTDPAVDSHRLRLEALNGSSVSASNFAHSGKRVTDASNGLEAQAAQAIAAHAQYVMIEGGSTDVCGGSVTSIDDGSANGMTPVADFRGAVDDTLDDLVAQLPDVKILVASIPNWYGLWERTQDVARGKGTCPLLFGTAANDSGVIADSTTRAAVEQRTIDYNAALEASCAAHSANCKYDGGAVYGLELGLDDITSFEHFHPTISGQAKIAEATWGTSWFTGGTGGSGGSGSDTPSVVAALGDSVTAAWGSGGSPEDNTAASWATGTDPAVDSHRLRLEALRGSSIAAFNFAQSGTRVTDASHGLAKQAAEAIAAHAQYVMIEGGSSDVCASYVTSIDDNSANGMTPVADFRGAVDDTLDELVAQLPDVKILVASLPDWYGIWSRTQDIPRSKSTCPLLSGTKANGSPVIADSTTRAAVAQRTNEYDAALQASCAAHAANCKYDGGAVHALELGLDDITSFEHYHPSVAGQAKIAAATWGTSWYAGGNGGGSGGGTGGGGSGGGSGGGGSNGGGSSQSTSSSSGSSSSAPVGPADLALRLHAEPAPAKAGGVLTYYATVSTRTGAAVHDIVLTLDLSPGVEFVSSYADRGPGCTVAGARVTCHLDWLSGKLTGHVTVVTRVAASGALDATATVTGRETDPNLADNHASASPTLAVETRQPAGGVKAAERTRIVGTPARDTLRASGPSSLVGLAGSDRLVGGPGDDVLKGGPGADTLLAGGGDDLVIAGSGRDHVTGGAGDDNILVVDGWTDHVTCGSGQDRVVVDRFDVVSDDCEQVVRR